MVSALGRFAFLSLLLLAGGLVRAQEAPRSGDELVAWERARTAVVDALELYQRPAKSGDEKIDNIVNSVQQMADFGPDVVPFLVNELEQGLPETFKFCAYALGSLPTPEAAAALRQAMVRLRTRRSSRGGLALLRKVVSAPRPSLRSTLTSGLSRALRMWLGRSVQMTSTSLVSRLA